MYACLHVSEGVRTRERKKEREKHMGRERIGMILVREVPRKRDDLFLSSSIRRSCDRRIDERESERIAENAREFPVETIPDAKTRAVLISKRIKKKWNDLTILVLKKKEKNFLKKKGTICTIPRVEEPPSRRVFSRAFLCAREREKERESRGER